MKQTEIVEELVERLSSVWPELGDTYDAMASGDEEATMDPVYIFVVRRCIELGSAAQNPDRAYKKLLASLKQAASDLNELVKLAD